MKKITLLFATLLVVVIGAKAQTLNNPKDADGYYIVKWDCNANNGQGNWAASNDFEVDENFVFAIDVTGTPFEDWVKETPTADGATRSIAINKWSNYGEINGLTNRLKPIRGNIYGATWNIAQMGASGSTFDVESALGIDSIVYVSGQVFGFEYTADNSGAGWWMWPDGVPEATAIDPGTGCIFKTLPYTGTKTSAEFYNDDYPGLFDTDSSIGSQKGYAPSCAVIDEEQGIRPVTIDSPVVGHEYYNVLGIKLNREPVSGLFIDRATKADGTSVATKVLKPLK